MKEAKEHLITALDLNDPQEALRLAAELQEYVGFFKVGLELFCSGGPDLVRDIKQQGGRVFLDLKFHDIPRTAARAAKAAARMGAGMITVHLSGGQEMLRNVMDAVSETEERPLVLGVTVLTSLNAEQLEQELGLSRSPLEQVLFLAEQAKACGLDGVVASPQEAEAIRLHCGPDFLIVTPGIRPEGSQGDDQKRIGTPASALGAGADYLVVGRPIVQAEKRIKAAAAILKEIEEALK